jgi:hypothetical protein
MGIARKRLTLEEIWDLEDRFSALAGTPSGIAVAADASPSHAPNEVSVREQAKRRPRKSLVRKRAPRN